MATVALAGIASANDRVVIHSGTAGVEGFVRNDLKMPLPFATVWIKLNDRLVMDATSDEKGYYIFSGLAPGEYELSARYMLHHEVTIITHLTSDRITFQDIVLHRDGILDTIVVLPPPVDVGDVTPRKKWSGDELSRIAGTDPIITAIGGAPGTNSGDDRGQAHFLGGRSDHNVTIIDGVVFRNIVSLPLYAIGEMSLYLTGVPARYGDFIGGAVIINTKTL